MKFEYTLISYYFQESTMKQLLFLVLFIFALTGSLFAAPTVITDGDCASVATLNKKIGTSQFFVLQASPEKLSEKLIFAMLDRVKNGAVLWFYDSRVAPSFGWKNSPMKIPNLSERSMDAEFGTKRLPGVALGAEKVGNSNLTVGVRRLVVFVPRVGEEMYSAIAPSADVIPLLKVPRQSSFVSAFQKVGNGYIIFKPLLWEKRYDGSKFQRRLLDFSSHE